MNLHSIDWWPAMMNPILGLSLQLSMPTCVQAGGVCAVAGATGAAINANTIKIQYFDIHGLIPFVIVSGSVPDHSFLRSEIRRHRPTYRPPPRADPIWEPAPASRPGPPL